MILTCKLRKDNMHLDTKKTVSKYVNEMKFEMKKDRNLIGSLKMHIKINYLRFRGKYLG